ncbi:Spt4/RpoE2 zinc finger-domain-containing protein [Endogone sp. FLAS-F59071]|nr:Spt4/RpoE2 zinc finger-domain-containing protein [Endogone sp. FLAS-F59071]|eukprot:RUS21254.1 Spt4/RpoE2 zinc finger-domain-containing protein [Endogone sp. FLAS-F59071]
MSSIPTDKRQVRACLLCSLVKNAAQFRANGCDNCEDIMRMRGSMERVQECTSSNFDGMIAMMRPTDSWVDKFSKGVYAVRVSGRIPDDVEDELERRGIAYRPRDGSIKD